MERENFSVESDELLTRQVDDFLFATPHHAHAQRFLDTVLTGDVIAHQQYR